MRNQKNRIANQKILIAPDSFKGSMTAMEAAEAMARGVQRAMPGIAMDLCPMADGGEGTLDALVAATGGVLRRARVTGPLGEPVDAAWGMLGDKRTAVIEMARAAGLMLVPGDRRDPTRTTTYGVGELIRTALDEGARRIILGIGGSATCDAGCGAAQALGVRFFTGRDRFIERPLTGGMLESIARIDSTSLDRRISNDTLTVACDVDSPLTGSRGAAHVFAPQKGATPEQVESLDRGLRRLARLWRRQYGGEPLKQPGAGAAGGLGAGAMILLNGVLRRGIDMVLEAVGFQRRVLGCGLVLTGEGRLDGQSIRGKTCIGVAQAAKRAGVRTVALVGSLGPDAQTTLAHGLHAYHALAEEGAASQRTMREGPALLENLAARVVHLYAVRHRPENEG